jgi:hypothetical protein
MNPAAAVANGLLAASLLFTPALDVVHGNGFSAGGNANAQVRTQSNNVLFALRRSLRSMRAAARNWHTALKTHKRTNAHTHTHTHTHTLSLSLSLSVSLSLSLSLTRTQKTDLQSPPRPSKKKYK